MILDRTQAPEFVVPQPFKLTQPVSFTLSNGIPVYQISSGSQQVVRVEWIFNGGSAADRKKGAAWFTNKLLAEGTRKYSAFAIQEKLASVGAFLEQSSGFDRDSVTLYSLSRFLPQTLELVCEILNEATFAENELEKNRTIALQGYQVNLNKTAFLAGNAFRSYLYGSGHVYGRVLDDTAMSAIQRDDLVAHHQQCYHAGNCSVVIAGYAVDDVAKLLEGYLGNWRKGDSFVSTFNSSVAKPGQYKVEKKESMQSSVRYGRRMFTLAHPDYLKMYFLNEILGGYFGSRLMQNIREDKGYTYGIHSSIVCMKHDGYLLIGSDVKKENAEDTLNEINNEMENLKTVPVSKEELETVRNYILGSFLGSVTTPFAQADKFKSVYYNGMGYEFYDRFYQETLAMNADTLMSTAQRYLKDEEMIKVISGE